jgi:hypothetical protein
LAEISLGDRGRDSRLALRKRGSSQQSKVSMATLSSRMTWRELCRSGRYKGLWVAIDNCRYDQATRQPLEGDVVDSDAEFSELCTRMRESGRTSCTIVFCETDVFVDAELASAPSNPLAASGRPA